MRRLGKKPTSPFSPSRATTKCKSGATSQPFVRLLQNPSCQKTSVMQSCDELIRFRKKLIVTAHELKQQWPYGWTLRALLATAQATSIPLLIASSASLKSSLKQETKMKSRHF